MLDKAHKKSGLQIKCGHKNSYDYSTKKKKHFKIYLIYQKKKGKWKFLRKSKRHNSSRRNGKKRKKDVLSMEPNDIL